MRITLEQFGFGVGGGMLALCAVACNTPTSLCEDYTAAHDRFTADCLPACEIILTDPSTHVEKTCDDISSVPDPQAVLECIEWLDDLQCEEGGASCMEFLEISNTRCPSSLFQFVR